LKLFNTVYNENVPQKWWKLYTNRSSFAQSAKFSRPGALLSIIANVMQEKITLYFSLSVVLKYKVPVYCYCKKFGKIELFTFKKNRLEEDFCVFRNGLISISDWVFGNVWSCSTLFIMKTSHKSDELKKKKKGGSTNRPYLYKNKIWIILEFSRENLCRIHVDIQISKCWTRR
jgi:hypothetical protein